MDDLELIDKARQARAMAYSPYSRFQVGAAVECADGAVFTGCNIENSSYGATVCAERVALFKAVSSGNPKIRRLAVVCGSGQPCLPCGICRQVIAEFATDDFRLLADAAEALPKPAVFLLDELLPHRFVLELNGP
jgi:cytidine deaminase